MDCSSQLGSELTTLEVVGTWWRYTLTEVHAEDDDNVNVMT